MTFRTPSKLPFFSYFYTLVLLSTQISAQNTPIFACDIAKNPTLSSFKFCNSSARVWERVNDLVSRLTLEEKIGFLVNTGGSVERLGIPSYEWWNEALHGVGGNGSWGTHFSDIIPAATSFPQVLLTAASFNVTLFEAIGKAVSTEARAMHNFGLAGLTLFAPNINIYRDPRWGRGQETPGEDPLLTGAYATALVKGMQERDDNDTERLKVAACCKHYIAYDLDNWNSVIRTKFNAVVTKQDLEDTFKPPFKSCVLDGNVASIMCSYNQINGKPSCADPDLAKVVRDEWKLNGYIVSDYDAIAESYYSQNYTKKPEEAAALALLAGVDLNVGNFLKTFTGEAVKASLVNESVVDRAISNNFATLMRLGFFDGDPRKQYYGGLGPKDVCTAQHRDLALEAARQGIVLLKNTGYVLPLWYMSLAVIGPNANASGVMLGNYAGNPCKFTTPLQGLSKIVPNAAYSPGCRVSCTEAQLNEAKTLAASADATILIMGDDISFGQECYDRVNLTLPGQQQDFITAVAKASKRPIILVLMSGGGLDVQFAKDDANIAAILWVGYPGEAGGEAITDVIFGHYNPGGKLPISWYPQSYTEKIPMTNMNMRPNLNDGYPGRTYRFNADPTVFDFGYGLSYSPITYLYDIESQDIIQPIPTISVSIDSIGNLCPSIELKYIVRNLGNYDGVETILWFSSPPAVYGAPRKQLLAFKKVHVLAGYERDLVFKVDACKDLSLVDEHGERNIAMGMHVLQVGTLKFNVNVTKKI